jgi:hypothetical protein
MKTEEAEPVESNATILEFLSNIGVQVDGLEEKVPAAWSIFK